MDPDVGEDIISNFPKDIIIHILSFLPTKEAVKTCVLSRSWIRHWTQVTSVNITDSKTERKKFVNFVNKVLHSLSNPNIHSVKLCLEYDNLEYYYDQKLIHKCIDAIPGHRVQKLQFISEHVSGWHPESLSSFFHCSSLVELDLTLFSFVDLPFSYCFPNLQILKLHYVNFVPSDSLYPIDIVYSFPVLKVFKMTQRRSLAFECREKDNIVINAPVLRRFLLSNGHSILQGNLKIHAPNLKSVAYLHVLHDIILVSNPLSVVDAMLEFSYLSRIVGKFPLVSQFSNLECLTLCDRPSFMGFGLGSDYISKLTTLERLICLKVQIDCRLIQHILLSLFQKLPSLEKLELYCPLKYHQCRNFVQDPKEVPHCFLSSLKFVEMRFNYWHKDIYDQAKYLAENLKVLQHLNFHPMKVLQEKEMAMFLMDMEELKKHISSATTIKID